MFIIILLSVISRSNRMRHVPINVIVRCKMQRCACPETTLINNLNYWLLCNSPWARKRISATFSLSHANGFSSFISKCKVTGLTWYRPYVRSKYAFNISIVTCKLIDVEQTNKDVLFNITNKQCGSRNRTWKLEPI